VATHESAWYIRMQTEVGQEELGPLSEAEVRELVTSGKLTAHDHVRREPDPAWHPAYKLRQLGFTTEQRFDLSRLQSWLGESLHQTCPACAALLPAQALLCMQCGRTTKQKSPRGTA
jgi:hypothetical protein